MNRSREAYAREHGLSAPAMAEAVASKRKLADLHNVHWLEFHYTGPVGFIPMPIGVMSPPCQYGAFSVNGATTHRDYCGNLPDHGRAIGRFEFTSRTCKDYEEVIKQGYPVMLPNTEYYYNRATSISKEIKQGIDTEGFYK